jgi:hypothetical protein
MNQRTLQPAYAKLLIQPQARLERLRTFIPIDISE